MTRFLIAALLTLTGCAGARTTIVADSSRFPISLSEGMRGPDGRVLNPDEIEVVGQYESKHTAWGLLYYLVPLTPTTDISEQVNQQIATVGGEAIIRLKTEATQCAFNHFIILSFIPFWPGCSNLTISGDIIRHRAPVVQAPPPPPAPPPPVLPPPAAPAEPATGKRKVRTKGGT